MVINLIQPSFTLPPLEDLVRNEQGQPIFTQVSHGLQATNQMTLWQLYLQSGVEMPKAGAIMDAGCGDGILFALAPDMIFKMLKKRRPIIGVDISPQKIVKARIVAELVAQDYLKTKAQHLFYSVQDPQDLATMSTSNLVFTVNKETGEVKKTNTPFDEKKEAIKKEPLEPLAAIWCNSMFHWIREPKDKYVALHNFYQMLRDKGVLCLSMSASGTARDFLTAYNNVMHDLGVYHVLHNPFGYRRAELETDPIGSRPLDELVNMLEESGFRIALAVTLPETITYAHPLQYAAAVRTYGFETFMKPVAHFGKKRQWAVWKEIEQEFLIIAAKQGWQEGMPWDYTQFNSYVIVTKQISAEERLLTTIMGEKSMEDYLHQRRQRIDAAKTQAS